MDVEARLGRPPRDLFDISFIRSKRILFRNILSEGHPRRHMSQQMLGPNGRLLREKLQQHFLAVSAHAFSTMLLRGYLETVF